MSLSRLDDDARDQLVANRIPFRDYVFIDLKMKPPVCFHSQDQEGLITAIDVLRKQLGLEPMTAQSRNDFRAQIRRKAAASAAALS